MKRLFVHNWQIKLVSVILACTVWYLIKKNIPEPTYQLAPPRALARP
ncbi:MAG TPA: hypothetical protein VF585_08170 [Chthoniobacterales bacterium]|jgi:YbbR domain-containing protein